MQRSRPGKPGAHIGQWLPHDVVEAARRRVLWCYQSFDLPMISFSGGKDSLATLLMALEVCAGLGIKPYVYFIDEEFVPTRTLEFVRWVLYESQYASSLNPLWLCWQMDSEIYCAGQSRTVTQWGADRPEWSREPPEGALMDREHIYDIFSPDAPLARMFPGRSIVSMLGVRASESLVRLTSVRRSAASKHPCFIRNGQQPSTFRAVPLYDWQTNDVFKFLSERQIVNPIYYEMMCAGKTLRTDTPLHGRRCNIAAFKKIDPAFFDRLVTLFPEVHAAALYNSEVRSDKELVDLAGDKYGRTWRGLADYIEAELTDETQKRRARHILKQAARAQSRFIRRGLSGVPLRRMFKIIVGRQFDHGFQVSAWTRADHEWQKKT